MKETKPIKRSKQLTPFSHEHHDALLFIWNIKQGLKNKTAIETISGYVRWFWKNHLKEHFDQEEKLLLPYLQGNEMGRRLKREHAAIRNLAASARAEESFASLAEMLNAHIRFEERQLFPHIEKIASIDQLNRIFEQLQQSPQCTATWDKKFWKTKDDR